MTAQVSLHATWWGGGFYQMWGSLVSFHVILPLEILLTSTLAGGEIANFFKPANGISFMPLPKEKTIKNHHWWVLAEMLFFLLCWLNWLSATLSPRLHQTQGHIFLFKYKASFSIALLADADANYCFQVTDVGVPVARGVILVHSVNLLLDRDSRASWDFYHPLLFLELKSWGPFTCDEAFLLRVNLLRPYSKYQLPRPLCILKYRLSRARMTPPLGFWHLKGVLFKVLGAWSPPFKVAFLHEGHMLSITTTGGKPESLLERS